jgi:hypothetical protein
MPVKLPGPVPTVMQSRLWRDHEQELMVSSMAGTSKLQASCLEVAEVSA